VFVNDYVFAIAVHIIGVVGQIPLVDSIRLEPFPALPGMKRPFTLFESVREFPVPLHGGNLSQRSFPTRRASGPPNPLVLGPELWRSHRMVDWGNMVFRAEEV